MRWNLSAICCVLIAVFTCAAGPMKGKNGLIEIKLSDGWKQADIPPGTPDSVEVIANNAKLDSGIVVIVEEAGTTEQKLSDYANAVIDIFGKQFPDTTHTNPKSLRVGSKDALRYELKYTKNGVKVGGVLTIMKVGNHFEQVDAFCSQASFVRLKGALGKLAEEVTDVPAAWTDTAVKGKDGTVQITLPGGWKQSTIDPNSAAEVQLLAINSSQQAGVMVLQMDRADIASTLKQNLKQALEQYTRAYPDLTHSEPKPIKIGTCDALQVELLFTVKGYKLGYVLTSIATEKHFDQVMAWTEQEKFEKLKPSLAKLADGLKEIAGPAVAAKDDNIGDDDLVAVLKTDDRHEQISLPVGWNRIASSDPNNKLLKLTAISNKDDSGVMLVVEGRDKVTLGVKEYAQKVEDEMANSYGDAKPGEVTIIKVNDQDAAQFEFHGTAQSTRLAYVVTVVQSDKNFIRVTAWTTDSKLKKMKPLMTKLAEGVKELKVKEED